MKYSWKGRKDRNRRHEQNRREWASSASLSKETRTLTSPPRAGEPAGTIIKAKAILATTTKITWKMLLWFRFIPDIQAKIPMPTLSFSGRLQVPPEKLIIAGPPILTCVILPWICKIMSFLNAAPTELTDSSLRARKKNADWGGECRGRG